MTTLPSQVRGGTFKYTFTLSGAWVGSNFDEVKFTLRSSIPASTVLDDSDAVATASVGTGEITFVTNVGTIEIAASLTKLWPATRLYWDIKGFVGTVVHPIDSGEIKITPDITRS